MKKKKIFISLTGMSGSGKTTLFNNLREIYSSDKSLKVGFMFEGARTILTSDMKNFDLSKYLNDWDSLSSEDKKDFELWQSKLCLNFRENLDRCVDADIIISDRSPIDQLVYYLLQCGDKNHPMYDNILNMVSKVSSEYHNVAIVLDTPLNDVQKNLKLDIGHHYTEKLYDLLNEKLMFYNVIKELNFLDNLYFFSGNDPELSRKVVSAISDIISGGK